MGQIICVRTEDHWLCGPLNTKMSVFLHVNEPEFFVSACQHPTPLHAKWPPPHPTQPSNQVMQTGAGGECGGNLMTRWAYQILLAVTREKQEKKSFRECPRCSAGCTHTLTHIKRYLLLLVEAHMHTPRRCTAKDKMSGFCKNNNHPLCVTPSCRGTKRGALKKVETKRKLG